MKFSLVLLCFAFIIAKVSADIYNPCLPPPPTSTSSKRISDFVKRSEYEDGCGKIGGKVVYTKVGCVQTYTCVITNPIRPTASVVTTTSSVAASLPPKTTPNITTTTTTTSRPYTTSSKCVPVIVTSTKKEKITITEKETVTVTITDTSASTPEPIDSLCADRGSQCGGNNYSGPTCCKSGLTCIKYNDYVSVCG